MVWYFHSSRKRGVRPRRPHSTMYFALFGLLLLIFTTTNQSLARKIRIHRDITGIDRFEILEDDNDNICTATANVVGFCAKYGAVNVKNAKACPRDQESLHCRCNSTKPTFLLQEERCIQDENVSQILERETYPGCKYHLVVENDKNQDNFHLCEGSSVPVLLTDTGDKKDFSVCTEHRTQNVISCKPDWSNSLFYNKGRWRKVWRLDPSQQSSSDTSLEPLLTKLSSNASVWKGFFVSLQATCLVYSEIGLRLRGQPPPEEIQTCLLLKISGSRSWILQSHQMNFTQSMEKKLEKNDLKTNSTQTQQYPTTSSNKIEAGGMEERSSSFWTSKLLGAFYGVLVLFIIIIACWLFREECCRRRKGLDGEGRKRTQRSRSIGNPTYERGLDNSLDLTPMTAVNNLDPSPYAVFPYAQVYQPIVENTRPHNENGCNNLYETLKSVKENSLLRRASYSLNQSLNRTATRQSGAISPYQNLELLSERQMTNCGPLTEESDFAMGPNSSPQRECNSTPVKSKHRLRSQSEASGNERIPWNRTSAGKSSSVSSNCSSLDSNENPDMKLAESKQRLEVKSRALDEENGLPVDETKVGCLIGARPSNSSSWQQTKESFVGSKFVTHSSTLCSSPGKFEDETLAAQQNIDSRRNISSEDDKICDSLSDRSSECHLSDLEIVVDSDCSEDDETENQSDECDRFYYVLEGPNPTPTL